MASSLSLRVLQAERTSACLRHRTESEVVDCARTAQQHGDDLVRDHLAELRASSSLACSSGCAHCCHVQVSASFPEMARLSTFIDTTFTEEQMSALRARLDTQCAELDGLDERQRATRSVRCALLVEGSCSAYEARPLACRGWNSADVQPCIEAFHAPEAPPSIPVHRRIRDTALHIAEGLQDGAREEGLDDAPLDLPFALRTLLGNVSAATQSWLAGDPLPAAITTASEPSRIRGADGRWRLAPPGGV